MVRRVTSHGSRIGLTLLMLGMTVGCDDGEQVLPGVAPGGVVDGGPDGGTDGGTDGGHLGTVSSHPRIWADADFVYRDVDDSFEGFWVWQTVLRHFHLRDEWKDYNYVPSFTLSNPAHVYVLVAKTVGEADPAGLPAFLASGWTKESGGGFPIAADAPGIVLEAYRSDEPLSGTVVLGPNDGYDEEDQRVTHATYTVWVPGDVSISETFPAHYTWTHLGERPAASSVDRDWRVHRWYWEPPYASVPDPATIDSGGTVLDGRAADLSTWASFFSNGGAAYSSYVALVDAINSRAPGESFFFYEPPDQAESGLDGPYVIEPAVAGSLDDPIYVFARPRGVELRGPGLRTEVRTDFVWIDGFNFPPQEVLEASLYRLRGEFNAVVNGRADYVHRTPLSESNIWYSFREQARYGRVAHNEIIDKRDGNSCVVTSPRSDDAPAFHRVDHNYFSFPNVQPYPETDDTTEVHFGQGNAKVQPNMSVCDHNFFYRHGHTEDVVHGNPSFEKEIFSNKSQGNAFTDNVAVDCSGTYNSRNASQTFWWRNTIRDTRGSETTSLGIRVGPQSVALANYLEGLAGGSRAGIIVRGGDDTDPALYSEFETNLVLAGYPRDRRSLIAFNTVADCDRGLLNGLGPTDPDHRAEHARVANNVLWNTVDDIFEDSANLFADRAVYDNNFFAVEGGYSLGIPNPDTGELVEAELGLVRDAHGLLRPSSGSQFLDRADSTVVQGFPSIDWEGQGRDAAADCGHDEHSTPAGSGPISEADVGPVSIDP